MNIQQLLRDNIKSLKPYSTARDEFKGTADVYLDANENPYPSAYNRYPDPLQKKLKERIGEIKNINASQIFLGNGSDEAIDLIIRALCEPGKDSILITEPTYGMYSVCAGVNNISVKKVNLTVDFDLEIEAIHSNLDSTIKVIFLCSPNNPSGNLLSKDAIISLIDRFQGIVVVDEAYIDFASDPGFLPVLSQYPNLIVMQTLSKAWGLAGLRLGMAFASNEIIDVLNKIKYPYNINSITQQIVLEKLASVETKNDQVKEILKQRNKLIDELNGISVVLKIYPSDANFILVKMTQAKNIYEYLTSQSIIVRDRSSVTLCDNCLRITVGTEQENKKLIESLNKFK